MYKEINYTAQAIATRINLISFHQAYPDHLISKGLKELYYQPADHAYIYITVYGVVVFANMTTQMIEQEAAKIKSHAQQHRSIISTDQLIVKIGVEPHLIDLTFDTLTLGRFDHAVNKLVMMHLAQSVALDQYNDISQRTLSEIKTYTQDMETLGRVRLGQKQALKFIGRTLNAKNNIAENLYILDSPDAVWEDEYLDKLHNTLARHFELVSRYKEIDSTLKIVEDNLSVYMSYNHHRESSRLEWIIIILIVIEVLDTFVMKLY